MAMGTTFIDHSNVIANFIPELWSDEILDALEHRLVMSKLSNTAFSDLVQGKGDTIHIPTISNLSANAKSARSAVTVQAPTQEAVVDISIDKHYEVSFLVEDLAEIQTSINLRSIYTRRAGYAIAKQIDDDLISECDAFTAITSTSTTGNSTFLTEDDIMMAKTIMDEQDCPNEDRHIVIAPQMYNELLQVPRFTEYQMLGPRGVGIIPEGALGTIHGFTVWMTQNLAATGTGASDTCPTLLFHRDALALCMQLQPRVQANYMPEYLGYLVTVDVVYGCSELRDEWGVKISNDAVAVPPVS